ncbi:uracil-DNA glycosylase family protein [Halarcobacter ebronensis]|uniref:DNA glycosylase n=1 Tax=Halarcobacter ebronensis TaxID=1462615 RepID=A0A4Q1AFQ9_9BACT|nr:uracil-DNA glycosylase family protein [Halarcobacter ebronensis]QKF83086.1 Mug-like uracil-DNA glycosylase [Halarcobacter ebronensis]RXK02399.1 DNA glycosylase [Halarcobacter ebronensis]
MFFHYHPYKPFLYNDTKAIIVGTLPPPRFCTKEYKEEDVLFCYGSKDNLLWKALDEIYSLNLLYDNSQEAIEQRKEFLIKKKIGICDIVESCYREKIDASDLGMKDIELRDILGFLNRYKEIKTIIFTGSLSKNSPEYLFRQVLKQNNITYLKISEETPKKHMFILDRNITTISLTSPSNAANRYIGSTQEFKEKRKINSNYSTFDFRVNQYKNIFNNL